MRLIKKVLDQVQDDISAEASRKALAELMNKVDAQMDWLRAVRAELDEK